MARILGLKAVTDIRVDQAGLVNRLGSANKRMLRRSQQAMVRIMKREAPKASGSLRNSIKVFKANGSRTSEGYESEISVGASALHAKYVVRRTGPSQGTYVPALGKRIQFGTHPGTPKNNFVIRSKPKIIKEVKKIISEEYNMNRINVVRFIKNG